MIRRRQRFFLLLSALVPIAFCAMSANAANITTHGGACRNFDPAGVSKLDYFTSGVRNLSTTTPVNVICPVEREPLPAGVANGIIYIDGANAGGTTTSCTVYSFDFTGTLLGTRSVSSSASQYDMSVSFPAALLPQYAYVAAVCTLPTNSNSVLKGVSPEQ